ncbi:LLM class flavin-dependent oxidoreductase [Nonomuraea sp. NN258]|uniref:LLM class flavin-dependent oxidoreductase n=1 Tax=Nonomuraea antri TaxID=2730852 RepID=UPI001567C9A8|nr:LLM class flavin-dependent oxidoreductase [Nonomuraea antri]NRQ36919.1 LLM class flavin-dependent oxidoreductase [Nonomuraea antri]
MRLGVMYDRDLPPEGLIPFARALDGTAVDDLWVVEDLGWTGAVSSAATALAVTSRLRVGIGITPAPLRNPMLLAMELANLARMHPGRLAAGVGHGVQDWMRQVGAAVSSPLTLLEETITAVRALLRGESVTLHGKTVHLDGVRLVHPPAEPPPVLAGVVSPRSLALSGRLAQGTIVPEGLGPAQFPTILDHIAAGEAHGAADKAHSTTADKAHLTAADEAHLATADKAHFAAADDHELVVFTYLYIGADAHAATREKAAEQAAFLKVSPDEVVMAAGTAEEAAAAVKSLWAAGAHTVVLRPIGPEPLAHVTALQTAL